MISCCTIKCINDRIRITILIKILKISKQFIILAKLAWPHLRLVTRPNDSDILTNISFLLIAHCKTTIQVGHVLTRRTCAYCDGSKIFIKYKCLECHGTGVTILMVEHKWVWSWTDSMKLIWHETSCWVHYRKILRNDSRLLLNLLLHKFAPEESRGNAWKLGKFMDHQNMAIYLFLMRRKLLISCYQCLSEIFYLNILRVLPHVKY